jgi:hypothetical protein
MTAAREKRKVETGSPKAEKVDCPPLKHDGRTLPAGRQGMSFFRRINVIKKIMITDAVTHKRRSRPSVPRQVKIKVTWPKKKRIVVSTRAGRARTGRAG